MTELERAEAENLIEYILNKGNPIRKELKKELRSFFDKMEYEDFIADRGEYYNMLDEQVSRFEDFLLGRECKTNFFEYEDSPSDGDLVNFKAYLKNLLLNNRAEFSKEGSYLDIMGRRFEMSIPFNILTATDEIHNRNLEIYLNNLIRTIHNIHDILSPFKLKLDMPLWKEFTEGITLKK